MEKKVFKYKVVYWIVLLVNVIFFIAFVIGTYNRIIINSLFDVYSIIVFIITILSFLSLLLLIKKSKLSILFFSIFLTVFFLTITFGIIRTILNGNFGYNPMDYIMPPIIYSILFVLFFIIIKYKYKVDYHLEIDQIGRKE